MLTEGVLLGWKLGTIDLEGRTDTEGMPLDRVEGILEMLGSGDGSYDGELDAKGVTEGAYDGI